MKNDLIGKHALVCGASRGIGRAAAEALAAMGANVTLLARDRDALDALARTLPKPHASQRHAWLAADVADTTALKAAVDSMVSANPVQILINNTAGPAPGPAITASGDQFIDTFQRHLLANHALVQATVGGMKSAGYGRIVNVISTSVKEPIANLGVSNTIRGAVANWAKSLSFELAAHGITVNNVLPGFTRTQRLDQIIDERVHATGKARADVEAAMLATVPAARFAEAAEIAAAIAFLASPAAGYINGINLPVDGGRTKSL